jgi:hypothetical protein
MSPSTSFLQTGNLHNPDDLFHNASEVLHPTKSDMITKIYVCATVRGNEKIMPSG